MKKIHMLVFFPRVLSSQGISIGSFNNWNIKPQKNPRVLQPLCLTALVSVTMWEQNWFQGFPVHPKSYPVENRPNISALDSHSKFSQTKPWVWTQTKGGYFYRFLQNIGVCDRQTKLIVSTDRMAEHAETMIPDSSFWNWIQLPLLYKQENIMYFILYIVAFLQIKQFVARE